MPWVYHWFRVFVYNGGILGSDLGTNDLLLETESDDDLKTLRESLRIKDGTAGHCMCLGDPTIELLGERSERLALITLHHGLTIRWSRWKDDAELLDGPGWLRWLADRGVTYPLKEYEKDRRRAELMERSWHRWLDHMPSCLRPFAQEMKKDLGWNIFVSIPESIESEETAQDVSKRGEESVVQIGKLQKPLEEAHPDGMERALVLLAWFGNGLGPWTGYPAYEKIADDLLLSISKDAMIPALSGPGLSEAQLEGGARFLAGPDSRSLRAAVWAQLSDGAKEALREHAQRYTDENKKKSALGLFHSKK